MAGLVSHWAVSTRNRLFHLEVVVMNVQSISKCEKGTLKMGSVLQLFGLVQQKQLISL